MVLIKFKILTIWKDALVFTLSTEKVSLVINERGMRDYNVTNSFILAIS